MLRFAVFACRDHSHLTLLLTGNMNTFLLLFFLFGFIIFNLSDAAPHKDVHTRIGETLTEALDGLKPHKKVNPNPPPPPPPVKPKRQSRPNPKPTTKPGRKEL